MGLGNHCEGVVGTVAALVASPGLTRQQVAADSEI